MNREEEIKREPYEIKSASKAGLFFCCLLWFFYSYLFSTAFSLMNVLSASLLSKESSILLYRFNLLPFAGGLILYGLWQSRKPLSKSGQSVLCALCSLFCMPLILILFTTASPRLFLGSAMTLPILIGLLGGYFHFQLSLAISRETHMGFYYAVSISSAVILQYVMQNGIADQAFIAYTMLLACFAIALFSFSSMLRRPAQEQITTLQHPDGDKATISRTLSVGRDPAGRKRTSDLPSLLITAVLITILLEFLGNFLTTSLLELVADDNMITYAFPRLFIIFAYLAAGLIFDKKSGKYLPVFTLCVIFITILNPILFHNGKDLAANTCLYYVMAGSVNTYFTLTFVRLSAGRKYGPLLCTLGRVIDSVFTCLFATPLLYSLSLEGVILIELAAIILMMLILAFSGQLSFFDPVPRQTSHISESDFANRFGLTEKETEVFSAALFHSGTTSALAQKLYMSRSVLYRHIGRICEKTGCSTLRDVIGLYYQTPAEKNDAEAPFDTLSKDTGLPTGRTDDPAGKTDGSRKQNPADRRSEEPAGSQAKEAADPLPALIKTYGLTKQEAETLTLFLKHPGLTQGQLSELRGITLRSLQRHLASIRQKTATASLSELTALCLTGNPKG